MGGEGIGLVMDRYLEWNMERKVRDRDTYYEI